MDTTTAREVYAGIARGDMPRILDVRNEEESARWKIEGPHPVESLNVTAVADGSPPQRRAGLRPRGVKQIACAMSMDVMGLTKEDLIDGVALDGVATFLGDAARSRVSLFI